MANGKVVQVNKSSLSSNKILALFAIAFGSLFTFQHHFNSQVLNQFQLLESSVSNIDLKINDLESLIKDLNENLKQDDEVEEPETTSRILDGGVYDIQGHEPHSRYLRNIETTPEDSRIPTDPTREYTYDDFESVFEVEPIHKVILTPEVQEMIKNHDATLDEYYTTWTAEVKELQAKFGELMAAESLEQRDREYMVVKWVSPYEGFGVFANKDIKKGEIIGRYTGEITADIQDTGINY